jgi:hypothetical protein
VVTQILSLLFSIGLEPITRNVSHISKEILIPPFAVNFELWCVRKFSMFVDKELALAPLAPRHFLQVGEPAQRSGSQFWGELNYIWGFLPPKLRGPGGQCRVERLQSRDVCTPQLTVRGSAHLDSQGLCTLPE